MKNIAASILLIALLAQISNHYFILLDYEVNKNFIAKTLCINRDKPMSGCNGKCYLKKQLDKSAKEENTPDRNSRDDRNEVLYFVEQKKIKVHLFAGEYSRQYSRYKNQFISQDAYIFVFHPPQTV